ncbi:hypothetical protein JW826_00925 [Candidatus Woesearchaeota archaeon]|nr:hypothetical protein [Candidatus Woesearchaeota archaeon]
MRFFALGLILLLVVLTACSEKAADNTDLEADAGQMEVKVDTDSDGEADVMVKQEGDVTEVKVDTKVPEEVKDAGSEAFCIPGEKYTYTSQEGSVDSEIIGLETYKGKEYCKAVSSSVVNTPVGDINSETTYYFDSDYSEYWIVTETSGGPMPAPQVTEVHLVDGKLA